MDLAAAARTPDDAVLVPARTSGEHGAVLTGRGCSGVDRPADPTTLAARHP